MPVGDPGEAMAACFLCEAAAALVLFVARRVFGLAAVLDAFPALAAAAFACADVGFVWTFAALGVDAWLRTAFPGRDVRFAERACGSVAWPGTVPVRPGAVAPRLDPVGDVARVDPFASALPLAAVVADRCPPPALAGRGFTDAGETAVTGVFFAGLRWLCTSFVPT